jgi:hypothetical protein
MQVYSANYSLLLVYHGSFQKTPIPPPQRKFFKLIFNFRNKKRIQFASAAIFSIKKGFNLNRWFLQLATSTLPPSL